MNCRQLSVSWGGQQGVALLMVLWVLTLLTVIVGQFCYTMRSEITITRNFRDDTQAYYLARAGLQQALLWLLESEKTKKKRTEEDGSVSWRVNADTPHVEFADGSFKIEIGNESGKININTAHSSLLKTMLVNLELSEEEVKTIVDSIQDWRDQDNLHRLHGAESEYYQSLPEPYLCHNGPFRSAEELLLVKGVSTDIFTKLREQITIYPMGTATRSTKKGKKPKKKERAVSKQTQININAAPPEVLTALPFMTDDVVDDIIDFRRETDFRSLTEVKETVGEENYHHISKYITLDSSTYYTLRATGTIEGSQARRSIEAVVDVDAKKDEYRIIKWLDFVS